MNSKQFRNSNYKDGKKVLQVIPKKGEAMGTCATFNKKYICCNVKVLQSVSNCPFDCTYCFLQNYLNDGTINIVGDIDALMAEVREKIEREPWRLFRIGTWELGDSLALEKGTGQASRLILEFSVLKNAVLELKTKSDCVDSILHLDHHQRTVVSWSLNTEYVINKEEHRTAPLEKRLEAMHKVSEAGYLVGAHFDPMIIHEGGKEGYKKLIRLVFEAAPPERFAWISIGSLRFNPEMKKKMEINYPESNVTSSEMVLGDDGKMRYVKPLRLKLYHVLYKTLRKYVGSDHLIYFCMERWDIWNKIMGYHPESFRHLDYLFAKSLHKRFGLVSEPPQRTLYEDAKI